MKEKILAILKSTDDYVSGQSLCEKLGVSRTAVWKAVKILENSGYMLSSVTNKGYKLLSEPTILNAIAIKENLTTSVLGSETKVLETIDSTNNYVKSMVSKNAAPGFVAIAREQTGGKGRLGRVWNSQKDDTISLSVLLRPNITPMEVSSITPLTGLAVKKAIENTVGISPSIKWPNDLIIGNKKICGILTEMSCEFDRVDYIIIGIGINCDNDSFCDEIRHKATSLFLEKGEKTNKNLLCSEVLNQLEKILMGNNFRFSDNSLLEYKDSCATLQKEVSFTRQGKSKTGVAADINSLGELIIAKENGEKETVYSGEVTVQGIY